MHFDNSMLTALNINNVNLNQPFCENPKKKDFVLIQFSFTAASQPYCLRYQQRFTERI